MGWLGHFIETLEEKSLLSVSVWQEGRRTENYWEGAWLMLTLFQDVSRGPGPGLLGQLKSKCSWEAACLTDQIQYGQTQPLYNFVTAHRSHQSNQNLKLGSHGSESESPGHHLHITSTFLRWKGQKKLTLSEDKHIFVQNIDHWSSAVPFLNLWRQICDGEWLGFW